MGRIATTIAIVVCLMYAVPAGAEPVQSYYINNSAQAPAENGPGYLFTYESLVQSPGEDSGVTYTDWFYDYYMENNSTDHAVQSWAWSYAGHSGAVMANTHAGTTVYGDSWPLAPSANPDHSDTVYREEFFDDASSLIRVPSVLTWDDGHQSSFDVFVESNLVPEPSALLAVASGLVGFACALRRRRS